MSRDPLKNDEYFDKFLSYENERISKFSKVLNELPLDDSDRLKQCEKYLSTFCKNKLCALYSRGYPKDSIRVAFTDYIRHVQQSSIDSYADMVDILSLAILLDANKADLYHILETPSFDDVLVLILKDYIKNKSLTPLAGNLQYPSLYKEFVDVFYNASLELSSQKLLQFTSNHWYGLNTEAWWYDSHKSPNNTYVGYWCWLAAAIIKIKGMDVKYFSGCNYIPIDLI